jgi:hypothetical protein
MMTCLRFHNKSTRNLVEILTRKFHESRLDGSEVELKGDGRIVVIKDSTPILERAFLVEQFGMAICAQVYE